MGVVLIAGAWMATRGADEGGPIAASSPPAVPVDAEAARSAEPTPTDVVEPPAAEPVAEPVPEPELEPAPRPREQPPAKKPSAQKVSIGIGDYGFEPTIVTVNAGAPVQLTVAQGDGCAAGFLIAELGISADNSAKPAVVSLPALKPGTYRFTCGMEMVEGRLVVR